MNKARSQLAVSAARRWRPKPGGGDAREADEKTPAQTKGGGPFGPPPVRVIPKDESR
jgi:hypothetical protein